MRGQDTGVREAVGSRVHHHPRRARFRQLQPAVGQVEAFLEGEAVTFPRGAADENRAHAARRQMRRLGFHCGEIQRAVRMEGRVRGGGEAVKRNHGDHEEEEEEEGCGGVRKTEIQAWSVSVKRGLMRSTSTTDTTAALAKTLKMPASGTCRSRMMPKPQSASPPALMLTKFMRP